MRCKNHWLATNERRSPVAHCRADKDFESRVSRHAQFPVIWNTDCQMKSPPAKISTQISGRYWPDAESLFALRRRLVRLGIEVQFPEHDRYVSERGGIGYTFDVSSRTLQETEVLLFASIEGSSFHILFNLKGGEPYVGRSASFETVQAISTMRPIVVAHPELCCGESVEAWAKNLLSEAWPEMTFVPVDEVEDGELIGRLHEIASHGPHQYSHASSSLSRAKLRERLNEYLASYAHANG
jgi:hypothetical protein